MLEIVTCLTFPSSYDSMQATWKYWLVSIYCYITVLLKVSLKFPSHVLTFYVCNSFSHFEFNQYKSWPKYW